MVKGISIQGYRALTRSVAVDMSFRTGFCKGAINGFLSQAAQKVKDYGINRRKSPRFN